jgi:hypothetical protein
MEKNEEPKTLLFHKINLDMIVKFNAPFFQREWLKQQYNILGRNISPSVTDDSIFILKETF